MSSDEPNRSEDINLNENISYCLNQSAIQDNLLQSYRQIFLTIESIALAIGIGVATAASSAESPENLVFLFAGVLLVLLGYYSIRKGVNIVRARGDDVSHWHYKIMELEQELPKEERKFTRFKLYQRFRPHENYLKIDLQELPFFSDPEPFIYSGTFDINCDGKASDKYIRRYCNDELTDDDLKNIIGKGLGHTRKVLDKIIPYTILVGWLLILLIILVLLYSEYPYWVELLSSSIPLLPVGVLFCVIIVVGYWEKRSL